MLDPCLEVGIGLKAVGLMERSFYTRQYLGRQRGWFTGGTVQRQQERQAATFIVGEPTANGVTAEAKQLGKILMGVRLLAGEEIEHVYAKSLPRITFLSQALLQISHTFMNRWNRFTHSRLPIKDVKGTAYHIYALPSIRIHMIYSKVMLISV